MPAAGSKARAARPRPPAVVLDSDSGADSDHLDSTTARKRRKIRPNGTATTTHKLSRVSHESEDEDDDDGDSNSDREQLSQDNSEDGQQSQETSGKDESEDDEDSHVNDDTKTPAAQLFTFTSIAVPSRVKKPSQRIQNKDTKPTIPKPNPTDSPGPLLAAPTDPNTTFSSLQASPWLVQSLANMAIHRPTGIQKGCIPEILRGRDCIGGSRTGSGKTVAFAVPILQRWAEDPSAIFALVLTPTRELALQILEQFKAISAPQSLKAVLVTGGADMREQAIALAKRPHLVIATPGRLADHVRTSGEDTVCGLRRVRFVVLDEADRLLDARGPGSMLPDVEECLSALPPSTQRQTLLFTATMTPEVRALRSMPPKPGKEAAFVCEVDTQSLAIPTALSQCHLKVPVTHREHYLHVFLSTTKNVEKSIIIFCNRTATAEFLHHLLRLLDHRVTSLHSRLPQRQRTDNLGRFRAAAARILVATDVAARGLDIPEVGIVLNYDVPRDPDDYIHRVGRTARAGRSGEAVTFVGQRDVDLVLAIESRVGRQMDAWEEEGVNIDTRVVRDVLKLVSGKKRAALLELEEGREVGGKRTRVKMKIQR